MKTRIETLIFGGGGVHGICYIGGLRYLNELSEKKKLELEIKEICGVSVGTIFGLFYLLGFTVDEMETEILEKNLEKLRKVSYMNLWGNWGFDTGETIMAWLESLLLRKYEKTRSLTFKELYEIKSVKFNVLAGNLNRYIFQPFNHVDTPDFSVVEAIRMSIGVPVIFTKKMYKGDIILDGGIISSYPIGLYKDTIATTFGFKTISRGEEGDSVYNEIGSLDVFVYNLFSCFMVQRDKYIIMDSDFNKHTVKLHASFEDILKFKLDKDTKKKLIEFGYIKTKEAFERHAVELE